MKGESRTPLEHLREQANNGYRFSWEQIESMLTRIEEFERALEQTLTPLQEGSVSLEQAGYAVASSELQRTHERVAELLRHNGLPVGESRESVVERLRSRLRDQQYGLPEGDMRLLLAVVEAAQRQSHVNDKGIGCLDGSDCSLCAALAALTTEQKPGKT